MLSREVVGDKARSDHRLSSVEDWALWLRVAQDSSIAFCQRVGMVYLMRPGPETSKTDLRLRCLLRIIQRHYRRIAARQPLALIYGLARLATAYAEHKREQKKCFQSLAFHGLAFVFSPSRRAFRALGLDLLNVLKFS